MGTTRAAPSHCRCRCRCRCQCHQHLSCLPVLQTHTTAPMASPIGWSDGLLARKSGAAGCMERDAQGRGPVALLTESPDHPKIAMPASPIGWQDGVLRRRTGAARMLERAAHRQLEAVLKSWTGQTEEVRTRGAGIYAIFRRLSSMLLLLVPFLRRHLRSLRQLSDRRAECCAGASCAIFRH